MHQFVDEFEPGFGAEGHCHGHGAVEFYDRGVGEGRQAVVQRDDPGPVGHPDARRSRVAGGDRGLQGVRPQRAAELLGPPQPGQATLHEQMVPARAVMVGEQTQRQRDARLPGQHRMAHHEDQTQHVVLHVFDLRGEVGLIELLEDFQLAPDQLPLTLERDPPAQLVDTPALGGGHQPCARLIRDARRRPLLERGDERILCQILGDRHVAHDASQPGYQPG